MLLISFIDMMTSYLSKVWKKRMHINIYVIEEISLAKAGMGCMTPRLSNGGDLQSYVNEVVSFYDEKSFSCSILSIVGKMLSSNSDAINLLIISAHGLDETGTNIALEDGTSINLRYLSGFFKVLPNHLVIYLSICKGAYPGAFIGFCQGYEPKPIVVSPVVSICPNDANDFQHMLIDTMTIKSDNEDEIFKQVVLFNSKVKNSYSHDYTMGMFKRNGEWFPPQGIK